MNTNRLYEGDIRFNYVHEIDEFGIPIKVDGKFTSPHIQGESYETITEKRQVILVRFPDNNYVELIKLKTLKDFINVYKEIKHGGNKYILKKDSKKDNTHYVTNVKPLNTKKSYVNVRKLAKKLSR